MTGEYPNALTTEAEMGDVEEKNRKRKEAILLKPDSAGIILLHPSLSLSLATSLLIGAYSIGFVDL